jgi:hypothetical protein
MTMNAQTTKPRFDPNSPEIKAYLKDVSHQFVREGTMAAFPTCYPGVTMPIPLDESRITAIDINSDGHIYGGTSCSGKNGARSHVFAFAYHGLTGIVLDIGAIDGATECVAVCCCEVREPRDEESEEARRAARAWPGAIAFVNGPRGGRAIFVPHIELAQDWIQEWGMDPQSPWELGECVAGEPVVHAVAMPGGTSVVGVTTRHLFTLDVASGKVSVVGEVPGRGRIVLGRNAVFGLDDNGKLWSYDFVSGKLNRGVVALPAGDWNDAAAVRWSREKQPSEIAVADASGHLFLFDEGTGSFRLVGQTHLAPVYAIALTSDGRIYGGCGDEIGNFFVCDPSAGASPTSAAPPVGDSPATASARNLGVAASVLEQRRYMYQYGDALVGRDGEIVFAENDNGGHMWIYFPKLLNGAAKT